MRIITRIQNILRGSKRLPASRPPRRDLTLGTAENPNHRYSVILPEEMRPVHLAITGFTGSGKTYFLENLIRQDIDQGTGFVVFDVHGDLADNIIRYLAQRMRRSPQIEERIVIIEPFDENHTIGFNPLEPAPHTSPFLQAQEIAHILRSRWETKSFGPRTEELLRSAIYVLAARNLTLLELPPLLTYAPFRAELLRVVHEPAVRDFWKNRYDHLSEPMKAVVREPLLTRISAFLADPNIREMVCQTKSTFTFRQAMNHGLWVVINLSKGRLGEENSSVLGSLLFTKLQLDIMARAHIAPSERTLFAVYADELQNLAGHNFATLIAEARKYAVSLLAGHQFLHQLSTEMQAAMLSVGSRVVFRLNYHDARELAPELDPQERQYYTQLLTRLRPGEAVLRAGFAEPVRFNVTAHSTPQVSSSDLSRLRQASTSRYAVPRQPLRDEISDRFDSLPNLETRKFLNR